MKYKAVLVLMLMFVLVACHKETSVIKLQDRNIQELDGKVVFTKDGDIKKSDYHQYIFEKDNFDEMVQSEDSKIEIHIKSKTEEKKTPDLMSQSPIGGFLIIKYECDIIKEVND